MEVDALTSAAGNGGVKRKREGDDVGVKDSPSRRAKAVEPAYPPPVPTTALTPRALRYKLNPLSPSSGESSRFIAMLTLIVHQGSRNAIMMVTQLPAGTTAEDLNKLFKDMSALIRSKLRHSRRF